MTYRKIKLREYTSNSKISIKELQEAMYHYYYGEEYLFNRELIITPIKNGYKDIYTIVFSLNGSPPKGECFFIKISKGSKEICGDLIFIGNGKISKPIRNIKLVGVAKDGTPLKDKQVEEDLQGENIIKEH